MIRSAAETDIASIIDVAIDAGLFSPDEAMFLEDELKKHFSANTGDSYLLVIELDGDPVGGAYLELAKATDGAWYLMMIAIRAIVQGRGHGRALITYAESLLKEDNQRILFVETSGTDGFAQTREFYLKCGYEREAQVRDYYATDEDMVLFRKLL
jgi:ribosomal protein S18 acetylase RimI-like enzyme